MKFLNKYSGILLGLTAAFVVNQCVPAFAQVPQSNLKIGAKTNTNKSLTFNRNSSTPPMIRWNESGSVLQFTNDGSTFFNIPSTAINLSVSSKTANYTILSTDDAIIADATSAPFTLTLPSAAANSGKAIYIVKIDSTNNAVTISGTVDSTTNPKLVAYAQSVHYLSDGASWRSIRGQPSGVTSVTTTYTVLPSDRQLILSGASFTITLPTAVGITGKEYMLLHNDSSLTNVYTINTTSGQTVGGVASGSYALYTNQEKLSIVSDGSNWQITSHYAKTPWVHPGTATSLMTASGGSFSVGTATLTIDEAWWMRDGQNSHIRLNIKKTATGTGASGTGVYKWQLPASLTADTTVLTGDTNSTSGANASSTFLSNLGGFYGQFSTLQNVIGTVGLWDSTHVVAGGILDANSGSGNVTSTTIGAGMLAWAVTATESYFLDFKVPIQNWQP